MARNSKQTSALEAKALKLDNKSEGMRTLFDAEYTVTRVRDLFKAPYGYVYGVAQRHGVAETAATRRVRKAAVVSSPKAARVVKPAVKPANAGNRARQSRALASRAATAVVAAPVKRGRGRPRKDGTPNGSPRVTVHPVVAQVVKTAGVPKVATATRPSATARVAAQLAAKAKAGRPTAARRAANRKRTAA